MEGTGKVPFKILVTDAGRGSAIAIIRSLGRKGFRVIAADSDNNSIGFRSRYAHEKVIYPNPARATQSFCDFLLDIVISRQIDLVIPVTDEVIQPLAKKRSDFEKITKIAMPSNDKLEMVTNKKKTFELAESLSVPIPKTFIVNSTHEAQSKAEKLGWPLVLKPHVSRTLRKNNKIEAFTVTYAENPAELTEVMNGFEGRCTVLMQRYCQGHGIGVELLMYKGQPLAAFQHNRLREVPFTGGVSAYRKSARLDAKAYEYSLRLLKKLKWTGLAMVEFKAEGSNINLMEINGRVWGSLPLAVASGVDFPYMLAQLYLYGVDEVKPNIESNYKIGLRCRNLKLDLQWVYLVLQGKRRFSFQDLPARKQALAAILGLFNPLHKFDILRLEDPLPGLAEIPRIFKKLRSN